MWRGTWGWVGEVAREEGWVEGMMGRRVGRGIGGFCILFGFFGGGGERCMFRHQGACSTIMIIFRTCKCICKRFGGFVRR